MLCSLSSTWKFPTYDQGSFSRWKWSFQQITFSLNAVHCSPGENYMHAYDLQFASLKAHY